VLLRMGSVPVIGVEVRNPQALAGPAGEGDDQIDARVASVDRSTEGDRDRALARFDRDAAALSGELGADDRDDLADGARRTNIVSVGTELRILASSRTIPQSASRSEFAVP
jgi:hypothetical protein